MKKLCPERYWVMHPECCCRKGDPLPRPESGLLSNTWKWIVWGETHADKARDYWEGTQENCSATWLAVSDFMVMGLVSGFSLTNHLTQNPSWWHMHCSAKMDASEKDSWRWSDMWCHFFSSGWWWLFFLQVGGDLLVLYSLVELSVVK